MTAGSPGSSLLTRRSLLVAALLALWVLAYRFNTLGGALGGFDNDHFLHFTYAKQVEAGEQPLRDFLDAGLQGARPSLTYELSALAQRVFGDDLRSEALLTTGAMALGAAVTYLAADLLAGWIWALPMTWLSVLLAPKLYGYPKVLTLAATALLVAFYARRPSWRLVPVMAAVGAASFLFRHDYAVYAGVGFVLVIGLTHRAALRTSLPRIAALGTVTLVLVGPSLWWIHEYAGLGPYLSNALAMSAREAQRTSLPWPRVAWTADPVGTLRNPDNGEALLYYLFLAVGVLGLLAGLGRWRASRKPEGRGAALAALSAVSLMVWHFFLRGSLEARFGDMGPVVAVVAAALLAGSVEGPWWRRLVVAPAGVAVAVAAASIIWVMGSVTHEIATAELTNWRVVRRAAHVWSELGGLPAGARDSGDAVGSVRLAGYLARCTRPADRLLVATYAPEVLAFADRRFAGGRATVIPGFYTDPGYTRALLARLQAQPVPLVLVDPGEDGQLVDFPGLVDYLARRYEDAGTLPADGDRTLHVLRDRSRPFEPDPATRLPCFR